MKELFFRVITKAPFSVLAQVFTRQFVPIFILHRSQISNHPLSGICPEYLQTCISYLKTNKYYFATMREISDAIAGRITLPQKTVAFCLDDGYLDQAENLCSVLISNKVPATFFLISDLIDGKDWPWDDKITYMLHITSLEQINVQVDGIMRTLATNNSEHKKRSRHTLLDYCKKLSINELDAFLLELSAATSITPPPAPPKEFQPLTWDIARELAKQGIEFAPHSKSHHILSQQPLVSCKEEILQSWERVKEEIPSAEKIFCYPTGRRQDFGAKEQAILLENGFLAGVSSIPKPLEIKNKGELYSIPRMELPKSFTKFIRYSSWLEATREKISTKH